MALLVGLARAITLVENARFSYRSPDQAMGLGALLAKTCPDPDRVVEDLVALEAAGADSVVVVPIGRDPIAGLEDVGRLIVPPLRTRLKSGATT